MFSNADGEPLVSRRKPQARRQVLLGILSVWPCFYSQFSSPQCGLKFDQPYNICLRYEKWYALNSHKDCNKVSHYDPVYY